MGHILTVAKQTHVKLFQENWAIKKKRVRRGLCDQDTCNKHVPSLIYTNNPTKKTLFLNRV